MLPFEPGSIFTWMIMEEGFHARIIRGKSLAGRSIKADCSADLYRLMCRRKQKRGCRFNFLGSALRYLPACALTQGSPSTSAVQAGPIRSRYAEVFTAPEATTTIAVS